VRTIDALAPLLIDSTLVLIDWPWSPPRLELVLRTPFGDGMRLRFAGPSDLRALATAIRKLLAEHRRAVDRQDRMPRAPAR
jgi:hypothetical protein